MKYLVLCFLLSTAASAQSLTNAGFESNINYTILDAPSSFYGWNLTAGRAGLPQNALGVPRSGQQVLVPAFTPGGSVCTVTQLVSGLIPGKFYSVMFYTSAYSTSSRLGVSSIQASIGDGQLSFSYNLTNPKGSRFGSLESPWTMRAVGFKAAAASELLSITVSHENSHPYIGFDDFQITPGPVIGIGSGQVDGTFAIDFTGVLQESTDLMTWTTPSPQPAAPFSPGDLPERKFWRAMDR